MAANNELENGLQESYDGVKDAANSALNAGRTAKRTVATAKKTVKKGKQAAKTAKTLFSLIPLPIKIYRCFTRHCSHLRMLTLFYAEYHQ